MLADSLIERLPVASCPFREKLFFSLNVMKAELPKHFEYQLEVSPFVFTLYYLRFLKIYQLAFAGIPWILKFLIEIFSFGLSHYSAKYKYIIIIFFVLCLFFYFSSKQVCYFNGL